MYEFMFLFGKAVSEQKDDSPWFKIEMSSFTGCMYQEGDMTGENFEKIFSAMILYNSKATQKEEKSRKSMVNLV